MRQILWACAAVCMIMTGVCYAASKLSVNEVASKLACYCGTCPHLVVTECGCGTADQIKADIQKMIESGMSQDQIIKSYIHQYGVTVLAAPPKSGFNLAAWLLPFMGFAGGFAVLAFFLKRQRSESIQEKPVESQNDPYRKELEQELEQMK